MDTPLDKQQSRPPPDAAKTEVRLAGHIGHLTAQEESALTEFKGLGEKAGLFQPATSETRASHDDGTLMQDVLSALVRQL